MKFIKCISFQAETRRKSSDLNVVHATNVEKQTNWAKGWNKEPSCLHTSLPTISTKTTISKIDKRYADIISEKSDSGQHIFYIFLFHKT